MPIANISEVWLERTYTPSVIHVSIGGCTVKQAMYRCYHRLVGVQRSDIVRFADFLFSLFFFSSALFSYRSLGRMSRNFGKRLKVGVISECLLAWAHIPTSLEFGDQKRTFHRFLRPCGHKRQCASIAVKIIENIRYDDYSVLWNEIAKLLHGVMEIGE